MDKTTWAPLCSIYYITYPQKTFCRMYTIWELEGIAVRAYRVDIIRCIRPVLRQIVSVCVGCVYFSACSWECLRLVGFCREIDECCLFVSCWRFWSKKTATKQVLWHQQWRCLKRIQLWGTCWVCFTYFVFSKSLNRTIAVLQQYFVLLIVL